jgi:transketolase
MRNEFAKLLTECASSNSSITLITGDLGYGVLDEFRARNPKQFINSGINEQAMMGMAAGMASVGLRPFVYSIGNFPTLRCLEQIRNDVCFMNNPVTIVSIGAGFAYGSQGYTHHAIEDLSILRSLPNLRIFSPADVFEVSLCMELILQSSEPAYLRLGKGGEPNIHTTSLAVNTAPITLKSGNGVTLAWTGSIGNNAVKAAKELLLDGIDVGLISFPVLSISAISKFFEEWAGERIITIEENSLAGGFGSFLLEVSSSMKVNANLIRLGINHQNGIESGSQDFMRRAAGIDSDSIKKAVLDSLAGRFL